MKKIEDVGLGDILILNFGNNFSFELLSMGDGSVIGKIICKSVKYFNCENLTFEKDEGIQGSYIPLILIQEIDDISQEEVFNSLFDRKKTEGFLLTMGEGLVNIKVLCLDIEIDGPILKFII